MNKFLFNLPRPVVPIFVRNARGSAVAAATENSNDQAADTSPAPLSMWVKSSLDFPVRRIYCVGRNYREHAIEMGGDPDREPPFFFQKPSDAIVVCSSNSPSCSSAVPYPPSSSSLHHEGELIVAIGKDGLRIPVESAMDHVYGYAVGCDLTRRDLQSEAKKKGRPWDAAKGFDGSCPLSPIIPKEEILLGQGTQIVLKVNNSIRQQSEISNMIYSIPEIIHHLSQLFMLKAGDLILTGTPAGVSNLDVGDKVSISFGDLMPCDFVVGPSE